MVAPTSDFTHLFNDMPIEERARLIPHMIESQKLHIWQCKQKAITAHKRRMKELEDWMKRMDDELKIIKVQQGDQKCVKSNSEAIPARSGFMGT